MSRFTPGPWSEANIRAMLARGNWINDDHSDDIANARLIAAAPEMLDYLEEVLVNAAMPPGMGEEIAALVNRVKGYK